MLIPTPMPTPTLTPMLIPTPTPSSLAVDDIISVGGDLKIYASGLTGALSLGDLETTAGTLWLGQNNSLASFSAPNLLSTGGLNIHQDGEMSTLDLAALTEVDGDITLNGMNALPDLSGLANLAVVTGDIEISSFTGVELPIELASLREVHILLVAESAAITRVSLPALTTAFNVDVEECANVKIVDAPVLTEANYLVLEDDASLTTVTAASLVKAGLMIHGCDAFLGFDGFPALVEGKLAISENGALETLDGLEALRTVVESVLIAGNPALVDIDVLYGITSVAGDVWITDNMSLTDAKAQALVDAIGRENIEGDVWIEGNGY